MVGLRSRDTGLLRNSRLMGIPEFRCMANDMELYRRSKVCSMTGGAIKLEGASAFQDRFYTILNVLLWRVCENYGQISQADFYKLYKWFHVTRKLLKPPPPPPDYISPFAKKAPAPPTATIKMFTRSNPPYTGLQVDQDAMRSKVDPARYLGSQLSLTDSISDSLRLSYRVSAEPGSLSQSDNTPFSGARRVSGAGREQAKGGRKGRDCERTSTAPADARRARALQEEEDRASSSAGYLPTMDPPRSVMSSYIEMNSEIDADVTIVDPDAVLDQGSELMMRLGPGGSPSPGVMGPRSTPTPGGIIGSCTIDSSRPSTPPLPSVDVLSKRQLKLLGTSHNTSPSFQENRQVDQPLSDLIKSEEPVLQPTAASGITPSALFEMAGHVGERMMVNRARLLFLQHNATHTVDLPLLPLKPPTAPPGIARQSPLPSLRSAESSRNASLTERATTAPISSGARPSVSRRPGSIKSTKLRSSVGAGSWSMPSRSASRMREQKLADPFIVQAVGPAVAPSSPSKTPSYPTPPPSVVSVQEELARTPHRERCSNYREPGRDTRGYLTLEDDVITMSETPLLAMSQDNFSSLSSFLPSTNTIIS